MIAPAKRNDSKSRSRLHASKFETLLLKILQQARRAFRRCPPEAREEAVAEVVAHAWVAFVGLMDRGMENVVYPTPLARYAVKRVRAGRCVGCSQSVNDVSSPYAQQQRGFCVERLDKFDERHECWRQILVEDRHAGPAETDAARIDFAEWLDLLTRRMRRIAELLAIGETTGKVAKRFRLTTERISQMRRELKSGWDEYQGGAMRA